MPNHGIQILALSRLRITPKNIHKIQKILNTYQLQHPKKTTLPPAKSQKMVGEPSGTDH